MLTLHYAPVQSAESGACSFWGQYLSLNLRDKKRSTPLVAENVCSRWPYIMNLYLRSPLVKRLIAILFIGAFAFAFGHAVEHVEHDIHCLVCHWVFSFSGLISAVLTSGALYACYFFALPHPTFLSHQFFLSPQIRSPPVVFWILNISILKFALFSVFLCLFVRA